MKTVIALFLCVSMAHAVAGIETDSTRLYLDSLEASFQYQHGEIKLDKGIGTINVPPGFRYLDSKQTAYIIHDLWGNPDGEGTLGMIVPENIDITDEHSWPSL
jgi:hypothetical protein